MDSGEDSENKDGSAMKIKNILDRKGSAVRTIAPERTVQDAIRKLCENRIGALVVVDADGKPLGIVTERDILTDCGYTCSQLERLACPERPTCPRLVEDIMTRDIVIGLPEDSVVYAMGIMNQNRIRHLPIFEDGALVGIVSIGDLVNAHLTETRFENRFLKDYIGGSPR
jgi:CBS domain-containing protein